VAQRNARGSFFQSRLCKGSSKGRYFFRAHGFMKERNENIVKQVVRDRIRNFNILG
jgi:hypothetical protein